MFRMFRFINICLAPFGQNFSLREKPTSGRPHSSLRLTGRSSRKICTGQGFKGRGGDTANVLGIGKCTQNFVEHVPGCPLRRLILWGS